MALSLCGNFEVFQCACGEEAVKLVETCRPDVFLFDLLMPRMSGEQLLCRLRQNPLLQDTPAVFMTARAQEVDVAKLHAAGAIAVIRKPFDPLTLGEQLRDVIRGDPLTRPVVHSG
ncbi:response regulator [Roseovarius spongiae]|nr:response regulator [Roseovarius spongiae]